MFKIEKIWELFGWEVKKFDQFDKVPRLVKLTVILIIALLIGIILAKVMSMFKTRIAKYLNKKLDEI